MQGSSNISIVHSYLGLSGNKIFQKDGQQLYDAKQNLILMNNAQCRENCLSLLQGKLPELHQLSKGLCMPLQMSPGYPDSGFESSQNTKMFCLQYVEELACRTAQRDYRPSSLPKQRCRNSSKKALITSFQRQHHRSHYRSLPSSCPLPSAKLSQNKLS